MVPEDRESDDAGVVPTLRDHGIRVERAILIVDVVESVRLMQADEDDVIQRWRHFVAEVRSDLLPGCGGRLVKSLGDGLLLEFPDASHALAVARTLIRRAETMNAGHPVDRRIDLRVGLHVADVLLDELDVYGQGVNLAARLAGLAGPGGISMSETFRWAVDDTDALEHVEDLGPCYLKHLDEPMRVFRLRDEPTSTPARCASAERVGAPAVPSATSWALAGAVATLAVLDFEPASASAEDVVIAELVSDALVARLAVSRDLRVISRWSTRQLARERAQGAVAWSRLQAHYLVRGRVVSVAGRQVAVLELVETSRETVLWSGRRAFAAADVLEADDDLSRSLAAEIAAEIASEGLRRTRTAALPSLDGNQLQFSAATLMHREGVAGFQRSQLMLEHLIDRYPRQPAPRAWSAMWHVLGVTRGFIHDPAPIADRAMDHVNRALDHDPQCTLALAMGGFVQCHLRRDLEAADRMLSLAVELNPNEAWAWLFRSVVASHRGQGDQAWAWSARAAVLSPLDPLRHYFDGLRSNAALVAERWLDAERLAHRSLAVNGRNLPTLRGLAIAQISLERIEQARETGRRILAVDPLFNLADYLAAAPPDGVETRRRYVELLAGAGLPAR